MQALPDFWRDISATVCILISFWSILFY